MRGKLKIQDQEKFSFVSEKVHMRHTTNQNFTVHTRSFIALL